MKAISIWARVDIIKTNEVAEREDEPTRREEDWRKKHGHPASRGTANKPMKKWSENCRGRTRRE